LVTTFGKKAAFATGHVILLGKRGTRAVSKVTIYGREVERAAVRGWRRLAMIDTKDGDL
jgi:hypothetical protein